MVEPALVEVAEELASVPCASAMPAASINVVTNSFFIFVPLVEPFKPFGHCLQIGIVRGASQTNQSERLELSKQRKVCRNGGENV